MAETEVTREAAERVLVVAARDERVTGLRGHHAAIGILQVLAEMGWQLLPVHDA